MKFVYVTYPNVEEARAVSKTIVEARLAACANISSPHESLYWWNGALQSDNEVAVIYKVTDEGFKALKDEVLKHHSYDVPCIVALPIEDGHKPFLGWVYENVQ